MLCELLSRTGIATVETDSATGALLALDQGDLGVAYVDGDTIDPVELGVLARSAGRKDALIVVAGTNRPASASDPGILFIRKPYHYRELVHKIWGALGATDTQARAAA